MAGWTYSQAIVIGDRFISALLSCVFFFALAGNVYLTAKRQDRWSWSQFFVVVASLIAMPILIVTVVRHVRALDDKPGLATLVAVGAIMAAVAALAWVLNKYWPLPRKPR